MLAVDTMAVVVGAPNAGAVPYRNQTPEKGTPSPKTPESLGQCPLAGMTP